MRLSRDESDQFIIWWSGTSGQAEWLKHFTPSLRTSSRLELMPRRGRDLPDGLRPLFALEHPDLVVSDVDGRPLLSIEITEQAAFGTNSQQRMARMWSAVANRVPCAYVLPVESYQIDLDRNDRGPRLRKHDNPELALFVDAIPGLSVSHCLANGVNTPTDVVAAVESDSLDLPANRRIEVLNFMRRHVLNSGRSHHLPVVPVDEAYHTVGNRSFRAYLRRPGIPESMVLMWLHQSSRYSAAYPFQIVAELRFLFETNGTPHLLDCAEAPSLAYRNLPLPPGESVVVQRESNLDEMTHFFRFVDDVVSGKPSGDYFRGNFAEPNEYFDESVITQWRKRPNDDLVMSDAPSGDYVLAPKRFVDVLDGHFADGRVVEMAAEALIDVNAVNVLRMFNATRSRSLADPYSGMLATRDVLLCRDGNASELIRVFAHRNEALVFWVEMRGHAATDHPFLVRLAHEQALQRGFNGSEGDLQGAVNFLLRYCHPDEISKSLRAHLILSDMIVVQRRIGGSSTFEFALGLPALLRVGLLDTSAACLRGLHQ